MKEPVSEGQEHQMSSTKSSNEPLFGVLVMMIVMILLVLLASYGGWFLYHGVKKSRSDVSMPSIESIPLAANMVVNEEKGEVSKPEEERAATTQEKDINKKIAIKVLNGGAAKGSAGVVADLLKGALYTAVSTGNSSGDYTAITVYFKSPATETDANVVKEILLKKYPSSVTKQAIAGNADTIGNPITIIIGK